MLPSPTGRPQAGREAAVQGWCADRGYAAPRALAVLGPDDGFDLPTQVMERAPGTTMLDAVSAKPWRARRLVDQLAGLALRLHALPTDGFPPDAGDPRRPPPAACRGRSSRSSTAPTSPPRSTRRGARRPRAMDGPPVVCHGDFHPLNVMVDGDRASVIDWTDAGLGPREADVARTALLFHIAAIAADSARRARGAQGGRATPVPSLPDAPTRRGRRSIPRACACGRCCTACTAGRRSRCSTPVASTGRSSAEAGQIPLGVRDFLRARVEQDARVALTLASAGAAGSVAGDGDAVQDAVGVAVVAHADVERSPGCPTRRRRRRVQRWR